GASERSWRSKMPLSFPLACTKMHYPRFFLDYAEKHSTRTNIPKINRPALLNFCFPCPPIKEQNKFYLLCKQVISLTKKSENYSHESENLFNSLLQKAFRGEL
ncbi:restriction endonuclease subunit S, partial [Spirulina sp.]|uniref:restriction endonuclease subunit S n=1 Tax=Spirulina sp. TaxID=1157 RepID=UPI003F6E8E1F